MTIKPLADRVVLKPCELEETTKGGIILAASAPEKPQVAEVVAVGPGGTVDGNEVKMLSLIHIFSASSRHRECTPQLCRFRFRQQSSCCFGFSYNSCLLYTSRCV